MDADFPEQRFVLSNRIHHNVIARGVVVCLHWSGRKYKGDFLILRAIILPWLHDLYFLGCVLGLSL